MPIVYRCHRCGFILHVFVRVGQNSYGVPTPSELASQFGGICPRCGAPLGKPTLNDIITKPNGAEELRRVLEEAKQIMRISFRSLEKYLYETRVPSVEAPSSSTATAHAET